MKFPGAPPEGRHLQPRPCSSHTAPRSWGGGEATDPEVPLQGSRAPLRNASCNDGPRVDHRPFLGVERRGVKEAFGQEGEPWETEPGQRKALSSREYPSSLTAPGIHHAPLGHFPLPLWGCLHRRQASVHPVPQLNQGCWGRGGGKRQEDCFPAPPCIKSIGQFLPSSFTFPTARPPTTERITPQTLTIRVCKGSTQDATGQGSSALPSKLGSHRAEQVPDSTRPQPQPLPEAFLHPKREGPP